MIRELNRDDLPEIKTIIDATELFPSSMLDEMVHQFLNDNEAKELWLVLTNPQPLGVAYVAPEKLTDGTFNLQLIAVHPQQQGKGFGAELVAEVEKRLRALGARILLVETSGVDEFEPPRRFYLKNGYELEGRIRDFYQEGDDKVIFRKSLA
ncbi:MAG: GNAT family N-acetyltransferase [Agrobacterium tumefaciens]|jgi:ribosomal protein S18 acetylase RimI-like enzyme